MPVTPGARSGDGRVLGASAFAEAPVSPAYVKDYDAIPGNGPADWAEQWDVSGWRVFLAREGEACVGGAVVRPGDEELGRANETSEAVLWDIRVRPASRGGGVGAALFEAACGWARDQRCSALIVETQDVNVPACRLYAGRGCELVSATPGAYADVPDEARLIWRKALA
jgi:GNAT superfamily N-acetyltransferase